MIGVAALLLFAVPEELRFEPWVVEDQVAVSVARSGSETPWIRGVAEIGAPAERVFALLCDYGGYAALFAPVVRKSAVIERLGDNARLHLVWHYPFPFRNRDAIVRYETRRLEDGVFLVSWKDDARKGDPAEGVRIRRVAGETWIEPLSPERCRVTYTFLGDLGGSFPKAGEEKAWKREPVTYVLALRRRLEHVGPAAEAPAGSGLAGSRRPGEGVELLQDLVGSNPDLVVLGEVPPPDSARRVDEELGRACDVGSFHSTLLMEEVIASRDDRACVRKHRERVALLCGERRRDIRRIDADGHNPRAASLEFGPLFLKTPQLGVAVRSPVAAVENQKHPGALGPRCAQLRQRDHPAGRVREPEVGGLRSHFRSSGGRGQGRRGREGGAEKNRRGGGENAPKAAITVASPGRPTDQSHRRFILAPLDPDPDSTSRIARIARGIGTRRATPISEDPDTMARCS